MRDSNFLQDAHNHFHHADYQPFATATPAQPL